LVPGKRAVDDLHPIARLQRLAHAPFPPVSTGNLALPTHSRQPGRRPDSRTFGTQIVDRFTEQISRMRPPRKVKTPKHSCCSWILEIGARWTYSLGSKGVKLTLTRVSGGVKLPGLAHLTLPDSKASVNLIH
jgi:hypothetical protein